MQSKKKRHREEKDNHPRGARKACRAWTRGRLTES
jgi:hypothetical protein